MQAQRSSRFLSSRKKVINKQRKRFIVVVITRSVQKLTVQKILLLVEGFRVADQVRMEVVARRVQRIVFALCGKELDVPPHLFWNHHGIPMVIALEKSFSCSRHTALKTHEEEKYRGAL